jgi:hypothetical protein
MFRLVTILMELTAKELKTHSSKLVNLLLSVLFKGVHQEI